MTIRLVTDSTADIPAELVKRWNITVVPTYVNFSRGEGQVETLRDGLDIDIDTFYERLAESDTLPTTSQPTIEDFFQVYEKLSSLSGDTVISIHLSSKLSGTCNSAFQAKEHILNPDRVEIIDSGSVSMGLGMAVLAGARAIEADATVQLVIKTIEKTLSQLQIYFVLDTLEYLQKGGRIGKAQAFMGSLLSIKPILTVEDGEIQPLARVRTRGKALQRLAKIMEGLGTLSEACIIYNTIREDAEAVRKDLGRLLAEDRIIMTRTGSSLGVHTGPGLVGIITRRAT